MFHVYLHGITAFGIFISSDLPEVLNVCDNVVVMHEGKVTGELGKNELSEELIMQLAMVDDSGLLG